VTKQSDAQGATHSVATHYSYADTRRWVALTLDPSFVTAQSSPTRSEMLAWAATFCLSRPRLRPVYLCGVLGTGIAAILLQCITAFNYFTLSGDYTPACFPSSAKVFLANGSRLPMHSLSAGQAVLVARPTPSSLSSSFSRVYFFSHKQPTGLHTFVRIVTAGGYHVTATEGHYTYANNILTPVGQVRVGQYLRTMRPGLASLVVAVERVRDSGLIAPHTLHGDVIVNSIVMSTYTNALHPTIAHALLAPVRALVRSGLSDEPLGSLFYNGLSGLSAAAGRVVDHFSGNYADNRRSAGEQLNDLRAMLAVVYSLTGREMALQEWIQYAMLISAIFLFVSQVPRDLLNPGVFDLIFDLYDRAVGKLDPSERAAVHIA
jgi:Hint module